MALGILTKISWAFQSTVQIASSNKYLRLVHSTDSNIHTLFDRHMAALQPVFPFVRVDKDDTPLLVHAIHHDSDIKFSCSTKKASQSS
ncbi:hypothetical protein MBANPS3_004021 [Mucor bainieri]